MTVYVTDTNILFSAALNLASGLAQFIVAKDSYQIKLIAPTYLKKEMQRLVPRLVEISKLSDEEIQSVVDFLYQQVVFTDDADIPLAHYARAAELVRDIDEDDISFVALSSYADVYLLTGDLELVTGLRSKGHHQVLTFKELKEKHNIE